MEENDNKISEEKQLTSQVEQENIIWFTVKEEPPDFKTENDENTEHGNIDKNIKKENECEKKYQRIEKELECYSNDNSECENDPVIKKETIFINETEEEKEECAIINERVITEDFKIEPENVEDMMSAQLIEIKEHNINSQLDDNNQHFNSVNNYNEDPSCSYTTLAGFQTSQFLPYLESKDDAEGEENFQLTSLDISSFVPSSNEKFACEQCNKMYCRRTDLNHHVNEVHNNLNNYTCIECNKTFSRMKYLKRHISAFHRKERNYTCNVCQKVFLSSSNLTRHINGVHIRVKSYKCDMCQKSFSQLDHLKRHTDVVHKGIKNFNCEVCDKVFSQQAYLNQHIKSVHKGIRNFVCSECHKPFSDAGNLRKHINAVHEKIKTYKCQHCDTGFSRLEYLTRHVNTSHRIIESSISKD